MPTSLVDLFITLLLILINGVFSLSETAFVSARKARLLSRLTSPLIVLLSLSTEAVLRLLHVCSSTEPLVTEEEITHMIAQGRIESLPDEHTHGYETLGGLVMHQLGRIPVVTGAFEWAGWRFEVVDMDGRRVDKVLATHLSDGAL